MNLNNENNITININEGYNLAKSLKESFHHLFELFNEFIDKISNNSEINLLINDVKTSLKELEIQLKSSNYYYEEYEFFEDMMLIVNYLLEDKERLLKHIDLINEMMSLFFNLIESKNKISKKIYEKHIECFIIRLMEYKEIFYSEIYMPSENYDEETLSEIRRTLLSLEK